MDDKINKSGKLLIEFFSEEIPARMQVQSGINLENLCKKAFNFRGISFGDIDVYTGSRHLAIIVDKLDLKQKGQTIEKRGPRFNADEKALNGFLKSNNIQLSDTTLIDTKNGKFYFYIQKIKDLETIEIIPEIIAEIVSGFKWAKSQRWGNTEVRWGRPLRNILILLNNKVVKGTLNLGNNETIRFSDFTYGHRSFDGKIKIEHVNQYKKVLLENNVILKREDRILKIENDIKILLNKNNLSLLNDKLLMEEVAGLIEFPNVLMGSISNEFMGLPPEVLSTAMRVHQKYFSTLNNQNVLAPNFIFVSNSIKDTKRDKTIIEGNERVLKARLSDSNFFWKTDLSKSFEFWNRKLKEVVLYENLGSMYDKTIRISKISKFFSQAFNVNSSLAEQASLLSKADLVSEMVGEFPELQGVMGGYYASEMNYPELVSKAISEHYKPKGILDTIPTTSLGGMLSMSDKIDTLTSFFVIDKKPSGSKDPLALRRSASGIVQILIGFNLKISIDELFKYSLTLHNNVLISVEEELKNFIIDRLRIILKTEEIKPDIIDSVLSLDNINNVPFLIIYKRIHLLNKIISLDEFNMFLVNFKRLNNILKSEGLSKYNSLNVNVDLLKTSFETNLCEMINDINDLSTKLQNELNIQEIVLDKFVEAYPSINLFFENTIINDKNEIIRENRLCLLFKLKQAIVNYANFDLIDS